MTCVWRYGYELIMVTVRLVRITMPSPWVLVLMTE
jgi:hypothetical protein